MVYQDELLDKTPVYVYSIEEHAEAEVNKKLVKETERVLGHVVSYD